MKFLLPVALLFLCIGTGCKKHNAIINKNVVGTWKLLLEYPDINGSILRPTSDSVYLLNLLSDSSYTSTLNNAVFDTGTFSISMAQVDITNSVAPCIIFSPYKTNGILSNRYTYSQFFDLNGDTLMLTGVLPGEGGYSEYLRIH